jgi:hypothetical protein
MEKEIWKPIVGYETLYEISNMGRVKSHVGRSNSKPIYILKPIVQSNGYCVVGLNKKGVSKIKRIHILVAKHFIDNPLNLPEVNHKFGVKTDNRSSVLEWSTRQNNIDHAINTGLTLQRGENSPNSILSNDQALFIFKSTINRKDLCKMFGINKGIISGIKTGKTYSCITGKKFNPVKRKRKNNTSF